MRSGFDNRQRNIYRVYDGNYVPRKSNANKNKKKHASLAFCWLFAFVVCGAFGYAAYYMLSEGGVTFSSPSGVEAAWGGNEREENIITGHLIKVEVSELDPLEVQGLPKIAQKPGPQNTALKEAANVLEDIGPYPKYLVDYESIVLDVENPGDKMPETELEEVDEDFIVAEIPTEEELGIALEVPSEVVSNSVALSEEKKPILVEIAAAWREHVVKNGETLSDIAHSYGNITAQDIVKANGLKNANKLSANQILLIPNDPGHIEDTLDEVRTRQMRVAAIKEKVEPLSVKKYTVAQGDSLWSISNTQGIELDTLVGSNTFKSSARLKPGVVLRIPNQDGIFYTLKKDDTIEAVAKRYGVSMNKIRQVNVKTDVANLKTGQEIFLPGARPEGVVEHSEPKVAEHKKSNSKAVSAKLAAQSQTRVTPETNAKAVKLAKGEVAVARSNSFRWPIMGRINSPFGWRYHPITKRKDFHTGIDIKANRNDPIKAAASGKVVYSGWMGGYGKVLVIEHLNGQSTLYAHCSSLLAGKGAVVLSGQLVARIGTTGRSTGPHLHFEVRNGNSPVNPIKYLGK